VIEVLVREPAWTRALPRARSLARRGAEAAAGRGVELTVVLAGDAAVGELNGRFRGAWTPTNVLAFPAASGPDGSIGEVILAFGVCAREAAAQGKTLADHMRHLTIHGVLHLMGYDHQTDEEAEHMEALEARALATLGVIDPYRHVLQAGDHVQHGR